jgi:DNA-3-methyladenine glycosylase
MPAPLTRAFYARPSPVVAEECLGKILVFETDDGALSGRIVETEAYLGLPDKAAHSYGGRRTLRNEVMYGPPGHAYVYLVYGLHDHLNLVTGASGDPCAVLVRAVEPLSGETAMRQRRPVEARTALTSGPGKLCRAFGIDRSYNGHDLCCAPLFLVDGPAPARVLRTPRIGVDYAGAWARRRLRFIDADSGFLSPRGPGRGR